MLCQCTATDKIVVAPSEQEQHSWNNNFSTTSSTTISTNETESEDLSISRGSPSPCSTTTISTNIDETKNDNQQQEEVQNPADDDLAPPSTCKMKYKADNHSKEFCLRCVLVLTLWPQTTQIPGHWQMLDQAMICFAKPYPFYYHENLG